MHALPSDLHDCQRSGESTPLGWSVGRPPERQEGETGPYFEGGGCLALSVVKKSDLRCRSPATSRFGVMSARAAVVQIELRVTFAWEAGDTDAGAPSRRDGRHHSRCRRRSPREKKSPHNLRTVYVQLLDDWPIVLVS